MKETRKNRVLIVAILMCLVLLFVGCASTRSTESNSVRIHFLTSTANTWGDCTYIELPNGENMMIDCGHMRSATDIQNQLNELGVTHIDHFVISHYHSDHVGALQSFMKTLTFGEVITTGYYPTDFSWVELNFKLMNVPITYVKAGDSFDIGGVHFDVLWPTADMVAERPQNPSDVTSGAGSVYDLNCHSMVLKLTYGENTVLFTGDIYVEAERGILDLYKEDLSVIDCDVLKIMHHGHNTSSYADFVQAVAPQYAFSMGTTVMESGIFLTYYKTGCEVYMSWHNGASVVTLDGQSITVETEKEGLNAMYQKAADAWDKVQALKSN